MNDKYDDPLSAAEPAAAMAAAHDWLKDPRNVGAEFRLFFEAAPIGMLVLDPQGRVLAANPAIAILLGRSRAALVDRPFPDLIHAGDRARDGTPLDLLMTAGQETTERESRFVTSTGTAVHTLVRASFLRDAGERVLGGLVQVVDLTARRDTEEALRRSETLFRSAFEAAPVGLAIVGADGRFLRINAAFLLITGSTEEEMAASSFASLAHPEDRNRDTDSMALLLSGRVGTYVTEQRTPRKDGRVVWVQLHVSAVHDPADRLLYFICQAIDITARKRAEQVLWEGEERFRAAFEEAPIGMALVTPAGRVLRLNRAFALLLGREPTAPPHFDLAEAAHPDDRDDLLLAVRQASETGRERVYGLWRFARPDGDVRPGHLVLSAMRDLHGAVAYLIAQIQDLPQV
jgi:two-component system cell cycle sensor histidine kinase/response regulator CckA